MAIIYNYPLNSILLAEDMLIGTSTKIVNGQPKNATKNFSIADLTGFIKQNVSLDDVLQVGNTSLLDAKIGKLYLYDTPVADYGNIALNQNRFSFNTVTHGEVFRAQRDMFSSFSSSGYRGSFEVSNITANRVWDFPNESGTIALLSDVPVVTTPTLQSVTDEGNTTTNGINLIGEPSLIPSNGITICGLDNQFVIISQTSGVIFDISNVIVGAQYYLPNASGTIALTSDITTPTLQEVTDEGSTTSNTIQVAGITSGNFSSDGYGVYISDSSDGINNFQYIPYAGLFVGNWPDIYTHVSNDASILFQNLGGYGSLRSDLLTNYVEWQLPDAYGTIALTSDIGTWGALNYPTWTTGTPFVKMTAAGTFALDTTSYYPYPTGTISQYIRGDGTLSTFPSVATPTLQQVTTAGNTTTDAIYLQSGLSPNSVILSNGYISLFNNITNRQISISTSNDIAFSDVGGSSLYLKAPATITATNTQTLQNASGTIALLSDITTPTLQEVLDNNHDLVDSINLQGTFAGSFNTGTHINAFGYEAGKNNSGSNCNFIGQYSGINNSGERVIALGISSGFANTYNDVYLFGSGASATENGQLVFANSGNNARLSTSLLNSSRQYNLPNASGTIALVSDIPTTSGIPHATASGTDTYTATVTGVTAYNDADAYLIRFTNGNTTGATLNINALGAIPLHRNNDGPLLGGDILDGGEMLCIYNSTLVEFQVIGISPNSLIAYVTNDDSVTLTKGMPVYAFSGQGDRMTVKRANNTGDATSAQTVGLVLSTSIAANQRGVIMMQGLLDGLSILPTATWNDGDPVYLGDTPGTITNIKPYAPNHLVYLGVVTTASNGSAGRMYVRVQNGYELSEIHDIDLITNAPTNNQALIYETSTDLWKNKTIIEDSITDGVTAIAPSQNAVFDALALKQNSLAYTPYRFVQTSQTAVTGTLAETIIAVATIVGNTFNNSDIMEVLFKITKSTNAGITMRLKINTVNTLVGATQIAVFNTAIANTYAVMTRVYDLQVGNLYGYNFTSSIISDRINTNTIGNSTSYNTANTLYLFFTIQLGNIADSGIPNFCNITN